MIQPVRIRLKIVRLLVATVVCSVLGTAAMRAGGTGVAEEGFLHPSEGRGDQGW